MQITPSVPSKDTISSAFHAKSTQKANRTYQKQFQTYCREKRNSLDAKLACHGLYGFFHDMYTKGRKARTIDLAKTTPIAFFSGHKLHPNPAKHSETKRYVVGLHKYNKQNNIDEEHKAHLLQFKSCQ